MMQGLSRCQVRRLAKVLPTYDVRALATSRLLRARWRPSPIPQEKRVKTGSPTDSRSGQVGSDGSAAGPQEDPEFVRRGRTGLVVAFGITAVNGYIFFKWQMAGSAAKKGDTTLLDYMSDNFLCSKKNYNEGRWYTTITSGFSHIEIWHLLANTIGVISFYPAVAAQMGVVPSLLVYLASIAGGSVASLYHAGQWQEKDRVASPLSFLSPFAVPAEQKPDIPGLGASAGVFGVFTLSVVFAPMAGVSVFFIPLPAWLAWGLLTGVDSYCALSPEGRKKMVQLTGIQMGHEAHLGGSATGLLASFLLVPRFWMRR